MGYSISSVRIRSDGIALRHTSGNDCFRSVLRRRRGRWPVGWRHQQTLDVQVELLHQLSRPRQSGGGLLEGWHYGATQR